MFTGGAGFLPSLENNRDVPWQHDLVFDPWSNISGPETREWTSEFGGGGLYVFFPKRTTELVW